MKRFITSALFLLSLAWAAYAVPAATSTDVMTVGSAATSEHPVGGHHYGRYLSLDTVEVRGHARHCLRLDTINVGGHARRRLHLDTVSVTAPSRAAVRDGVKGRYIFVPDSLVRGVESVVAGYSSIVNDDYNPDPNDLVIVQGDTISPIIHELNIGRFDRGLFNYIYIPKGKWSIGLTASYGEFSSSDLQILDIVDNLDFSVSSYSIKPSVSYFIRNNMSVGLRFGYTRSKANLGSLDVDFDEDMNFSIRDASYLNESYTSAFTFRQYIGLTRAGRFGIFHEVELAFASGNSSFRRAYDGLPKTTRTNYSQVNLNFSPGVSVFMMEQVSFNVSLGVFGFHLRNERQRTITEPTEEGGEISEIETGNRFTSGANFRFNIFNINFGLAVHF